MRMATLPDTYLWNPCCCGPIVINTWQMHDSHVDYNAHKLLHCFIIGLKCCVYILLACIQICLVYYVVNEFSSEQCLKVIIWIEYFSWLRVTVWCTGRITYILSLPDSVFILFWCGLGGVSFMIILRQYHRLNFPSF